MGDSGFIIKKNGVMTLEELLHKMRIAAEKAGLEYHEESEVYESKYVVGHYTYCYIANYFVEEDVPGKRELLVTVYSTDKYLDRYDWIIEGGELYGAVYFEDLAHREEILLDFLYEYLKRNPKDYFYTGYKWYYTYEDIVNLRYGEFEPLWCYNPPVTEDNSDRMEESDYGRLTAGHIIKQTKEKTIYEIVHDVETAAGNAHLKVRVDSELYQNRYDRILFTVAHISEDVPREGVDENELLLYILFGTEYFGYGDFDWVEENAKLFRAIVIHKISGREKMLLDFLDEYFKLNPNDYFVDAYTLHEGDKWYYSPEDIKNIKEKEFDAAWCYKKPPVEERLERETAKSDRMAGIPAFILKRGRKKSVRKIKRDVKTAAGRAGLKFRFDTDHNTYWKKPAEAVCNMWGYCQYDMEQQLQVIIRSTEKEIHRYDWFPDGGNLIHAVTFTNISDNEGILLVFLHEYFKICPEDYLVVGNTAISEDSKWYYTRKEIEKFVQRIPEYGFDEMWCYKNPHIGLKTWSHDIPGGPILYEED